MKNSAAVLFAVCAMSLSGVSAATTDTNRTVTSIGVQGDQAYLTVTPALSGSCLYNIVYITGLSTTSGKMLYATLMSAYSSGLPLQRVDYANVGAAGTQCVISLIGI